MIKTKNEQAHNAKDICKLSKSPELSENEATFHWWPNEDTSLHSHDYYEIFIVTGSRALHEINFKRQELQHGTLRLIRKNDCHRFIKSDGFSCLHMNFCVTEKRLEKICSAMKLTLSQLEELEEPQITLSTEELAFFTENSQLLSFMVVSEQNLNDILICELISRAVSLICNEKILYKINYPQWFAQLLERIHSSENIAVSASDVYKMGGFSPPVMIEYFKKYTGKTVNAYLRDMKCERACALLGTTRLSTLEISTSLGYESLSHFNRIFRDYAGVSPAAYRHRMISGAKE